MNNRQTQCSITNHHRKTSAILTGTTTYIVVIAFLAGLKAGIFLMSSSSNQETGVKSSIYIPSFEVEVNRRVEEALLLKGCGNESISHHEDTTQNVLRASSRGRYPNIDLAHGVARINEKSFKETYDYGYPEWTNTPDNYEEVLIFYDSDRSLPNNVVKARAATNNEVEPPLFQNALEATQNCAVMSVLVTGKTEGYETMGMCVVIRDHYSSNLVERWQRVTPNASLQVVPRTYRPPTQEWDKLDMAPPGKEATKSFFRDLNTYLDSFHKTSVKLDAILKPIAINNTVVVMICTRGQAILLMNFACSARAKGFQLSNVVVFATDVKTEKIAQSMGLTTFRDERNYAHMPAGIELYGDRAFTSIMWAKVVSAHLVSSLGYDFIFQDVDVVWLRDPREFFSDKTRPEWKFDLLFQDDGARSLRFAPFSANSGFFFARSNERTRELFNARLTSGHQVNQARSDQAVFAQFLSEHASRYGLRVKTLGEEEFPAGRFLDLHKQQPDFMKEIFLGKRRPWIFHVSWTVRTEEKLQKFRQAGFWFVGKSCSDALSLRLNTSVLDRCCLAEADINCTLSYLPCADDYRA
jgi:hypothetical protein